MPSKRQESWKLDMEVRRFVLKGGVIKKQPMGVRVNLDQIEDESLFAFSRPTPLFIDPTPEYKDISPEALGRLLSRTGLTERLITKRLRTRGSLIQEWLKTGSMPYDKYVLLKKLIRDNEYINGVIKQEEII